MKGNVVITDKQGERILVGNIWTLLLVSMFSCRWGLSPRDVHIFIDDEEVGKPEAFKDKK